MSNKMLKEIESFRRKAARQKKAIRRSLVRHTIVQEDGVRNNFQFYHDMPDYETWSEKFGEYAEYESDDSWYRSGKLLAQEINLFLNDWALDDCHIEVVSDRDGYFQDAFLYAEVNKTQEDLDKEVEEFTQQLKAKEEKKNEKFSEKKRKKKEKELRLLQELKEKYE